MIDILLCLQEIHGHQKFNDKMWDYIPGDHNDVLDELEEYMENGHIPTTAEIWKSEAEDILNRLDEKILG